MLRLILLLLFITALSLGLDWLAGEPGRVIIDWSDYHAETSLLVVVALTAALAFLCIALYGIFFAIMRSPKRWAQSQLARRQALGLNALTDAFAAIATQDISTAKKHMGRAQHYLPHQPLTVMLSAQLARLEGNEPQARLYLEQMLKTESTGFMAMRALAETARRNHDDNAAMEYAEKALALKPQDEWLIRLLTSLYSQHNHTQKALRLLEQSARKRYINASEARTMSAYVLYENALLLTRQNRWDFAIAVLQDALRKKPGFIPASVLLAEAYIRHNEIRRAHKIIAVAWKSMPHPAISDVLIKSYGDEDNRKRVINLIEKLAAMQAENPESGCLLARLALKRLDTASARSHLNRLAHKHETVRVCTLMAELETLSDNDEQATQWLKRASSSAADPVWTCDSCKHEYSDWHLTCAHCGSIAGIDWK